MGDYLSLRRIANTDKNCSFNLIKEHSLKSGYGFAVPIHSPWLHEISLSVLEHQENGTVDSIENRWFPKTSCGGGNEHRPLHSIDFAGLFGIVAIVTGFSLVALLAEMFIVFILINCGKGLGPFGRFLKRLFFNVERGEEDHCTLQHQAGSMAGNWTFGMTNDDVIESHVTHDSQEFVDICELERKIAYLR